MSRGAQRPPDRAGSLALCAVAYLVAAVVAVLVLRWLDDLHPIVAVAVADVAATLVVFGFSVALDNSSVYDPYWSVAPLLIGLYFAFEASDGASRLRRVVVLVLVALWGVRLTANWIRRWSGLEHEDWRYAEMRPKAGRAYWLVSLFGFHLMPTAIVFGGCLPLYWVLGSSRPPGVIDVVAALVTLIAIGIEARADTELHRFQQRRPDPGETLRTGLWGRCRHPNYLGEILFWWGLYAFVLGAAPGRWWTGFGAVVMTLLFVFISVPLIDERMVARRPGYRERMKRVPALLPFGRG